MIDFQPFRALRPTRDKAYLVATRSYMTYSNEELEDKLHNNPYTFLHVINPEGARHLGPVPEKYQRVGEVFESMEAEGIFQQDTSNNFYIYRQVKDGNEYIGLIGAVSAEDYRQGRIKKHENTITRREEMFTDYLEVTGFNAEPVLLTYRDDPELNSLLAHYCQQRSEYEFTSTDRVLHQLWLIEEQEHIDTIREAFRRQEALYIADGHHRSASSALLAERIDAREEKVKGEAHRYFMAFLIGETQMKVYDYNRLVKNDSGKNALQILQHLRESFIVEPRDRQVFKPEKLHEIGMYLEGKWYKLVPRTGTFDPSDPIEQLDPEILSRQVLAPVFGIHDLKADPRVTFLPGTAGLQGLMDRVDSGSYQMAFALHPVTVEQIKQVSDAGLTMPPKSTYVEPKLRSGLTVYRILE